MLGPATTTAVRTGITATNQNPASVFIATAQFVKWTIEKIVDAAQPPKQDTPHHMVNLPPMPSVSRMLEGNSNCLVQDSDNAVPSDHCPSRGAPRWTWTFYKSGFEGHYFNGKNTCAALYSKGCWEAGSGKECVVKFEQRWCGPESGWDRDSWFLRGYGAGCDSGHKVIGVLFSIHSNKMNPPGDYCMTLKFVGIHKKERDDLKGKFRYVMAPCHKPFPNWQQTFMFNEEVDDLKALLDDKGRGVCANATTPMQCEPFGIPPSSTAPSTSPHVTVQPQDCRYTVRQYEQCGGESCNAEAITNFKLKGKDNCHDSPWAGVCCEPGYVCTQIKPRFHWQCELVETP